MQKNAAMGDNRFPHLVMTETGSYPHETVLCFSDSMCLIVVIALF